jgi:hypothetical protein
MSDEVIQDMGGNGGTFTEADLLVQRASDPVITPAYSTPGDFAAQWATPLDPTEVLSMAEEASLYKFIPAIRGMLKEETWREMNVLAFTSGSSYISFQDGLCPEEFYHSGNNTTVTLKNQGAKKSLGISDIMHSQFVASLPMGGINQMLGAVNAFEGLPGTQGFDAETINRVAGMKAQEIVLATILVVNGQDRLIAVGNKTSNSLEYDGIESWLSTGSACHQPATVTGSFTALGYDRFLSESTVRPTTILGHPTALQEVQAGYFQLGFQQSQQIVLSNGNRIVPGYNFASSVNTAVGSLALVADLNFTRTNTGNSTFRSPLFALRMSHNGIPLVYRRVQIPLSLKDLVPGCTAISFMLWEKSALIIKHACAHSRSDYLFSGRLVTTSPVVGQ